MPACSPAQIARAGGGSTNTWPGANGQTKPPRKPRRRACRIARPRRSVAAGANAYADLRSEGGNAVFVNVRLYTSGATSNVVGPGADTPSDAAVLQALAQARARGLAAGLKLIVDSGDGTWSAKLAPQSPPAWFTSYGGQLAHYASLAATGRASWFVIGTELDSLAQPAYASTWRGMIAGVRASKGCSPTLRASRVTRRCRSTPRSTDIGLEGYFSLATAASPPPSVAELVSAWHGFRDSSGKLHDYVSEIATVQHRVGKPVIFTEVGYASSSGTAVRPAIWSATASLVEQQRAYEALFEVFRRQSWFRGFFYWELDPTGYDSLDNKFDPRGKPAEQTLRQWWGGTGQPLPNPQPTGTASGALDTVVMHEPSGPLNAETALFTFYSPIAGATLECRVDTAAWAPCSSPLRLGGLTSGQHAILIRARSGTAIDTTPAFHAWSVG